MVSEGEAQGASERRAKLSISFPAASSSQKRLIFFFLSTCSICGVAFVCFKDIFSFFNYISYRCTIHYSMIRYSH